MYSWHGIYEKLTQGPGRYVVNSCSNRHTLTCLGNFIDTSNNYQFQESEKWIGEWMKKRDVRDQMGASA